MDEPSLPKDVLGLLERVRAIPDGYALLLQGELESIACLLHASPDTIEHAREWAQTKEHLAALRWALLAGHEIPEGEEAPPRFPGHAKPPSPESLVEAVEHSPHTLDLLRNASPETVAVLFGVDPFVAAAARELVARRDAAPSEPGSERGTPG